MTHPAQPTPEPIPTAVPSDETTLPPLPGVTPPAGGPPLWKQFGVFVGVSIVLWLVYLLLSAAAQTSSFGFLAIMMPFLAAMSTVDNFVKNFRRAPDKAERWWLIWWSFGVLLAWSLLVGVISFLVDPDALADVSGSEIGLLVGLLAFGCAISFLGVWAGYTFWPKRAVRNRRRYEERRAAKAAKRR